MNRLLDALLQTLVLAMLLAASAGCMGLNIPSERYYDDSPAASGETVPGGPRRLDHALFYAKPSHDAPPPSECLGEPPFYDAAHEDPLPSVPWPRFHPVPTAPVFVGPH